MSLSPFYAFTEFWIALAVVATRMAVTVARLVSVEVIHVIHAVLRAGSFPASGRRSMVAIVGVEVIVYVTVEVGRAMKPRTSTDESTAGEPLRAVVTIRGAAIGRGVVVAIGTSRGRPDVDADLGLSLRGIYCKAETGNSGCCKKLYATHDFTSG
jgi:hypothetical protein